GDQLLRVNNLSAKDGDGKILFSNINFIVNHDEKIALVSRDSAALTAFYEILAGRTAPATGNYEYGQTITTGYLPNDNTDYFMGANNQDLINWLREYSENKDEQFIRGFLGRMLFSGEEVHKNAGVLSGGEKVRCMLSKVMLAHPNFILFDEPTNHLDLESITALNNGLKDFKGNLIMTSHDHKLVETVCNRIIEITPNGMIDSLMEYGDYLRSEKMKSQRDELYAIPA
ncbi:MAG: ATP-binding cassette domain-containing protein, partial [Bacteroidota bacterium]